MALTHIFGDKPIPKVLDFFRVSQFWDYSIGDVEAETGVSYRTLQKIIPMLVEAKIIKYTRTEGNAKLYMFNKESQVAKELQRLAREVDFQYGESLAEGEKVAVPA